MLSQNPSASWSTGEDERAASVTLVSSDRGRYWPAAALSRLPVRVPRGVRAGSRWLPPLRAEQVHLLAAALDDRVQAEIRLEVVERGIVTAEECLEVVPLQDVPVVLLERVAEDRRSLELVPDELRALRRDDEEADRRIVLRDPGVPPQDRLTEHRGPLDLEQERELAAGIPGAVDLGDLVRRAADVDERNAQ